MEIKQCLNGLMVYQPAVNEDVCVADFIVKRDHLSKIAAKQRRLHRLETRSDLHLKIFIFFNLEIRMKHQKNCCKKTHT